jgi:hypothetical protein
MRQREDTVVPRAAGVRESPARPGCQARKTLYELGHMHISLTYPVIFADIELPGIAPARDNGWNSVYTSPCSGKVREDYVPVALDRADFNGYAAYLTSHSAYKVGVFSGSEDLDGYLRHRSRFAHSQYLRMDLLRVHQQPVPSP